MAEAASASEVDVVMAAIVGGAGLVSTYAAVRAGKRVCVANKALVMGELMMAEARANGAILCQLILNIMRCFSVCLNHIRSASQSRTETIGINLFGRSISRVEYRCYCGCHARSSGGTSTWSMGRKISVDSATLMNKGLG